ncbi:DUF4806 domain-containing protein, partial [Aphis craccivora]
MGILIEKISTTLTYVKRIDARLDLLESKLNSESLLETTENDFFSLIPIKTVDGLEEIEVKIKTNVDFEKKSGEVLARFFINQLAAKYSWSGYRNNNKLETLEIIKIIKGVCMKTFNGTDIDFENHTKNWFRHASLRLSREKKMI